MISEATDKRFDAESLLQSLMSAEDRARPPRRRELEIDSPPGRGTVRHVRVPLG